MAPRANGSNSEQSHRPSIANVAVVGTGVVGRSWARIFSRAGCETRLFDIDLAQIAEDVRQDVAIGLVSPESAKECLARLSVHADLESALAGAGPLGLPAPNADGGIRDYLTRYGKVYDRLVDSLAPTRHLTPDRIEQLAQSTDQMLGAVSFAALRRERDVRVQELRRTVRGMMNRARGRRHVRGDAESGHTWASPCGHRHI